MKVLKKALCLVMVLLTLFSICGCGKPKVPEIELSELSDKELVDYLISLGLEIPEGCDVPENNTKMIRHIVDELEKDPNWEYVTSMYWNMVLSLRVKVIVSKFYGNNSIAEEAQRRLDGIEDDNITDMYEQ